MILRPSWSLPRYSRLSRPWGDMKQKSIALAGLALTLGAIIAFKVGYSQANTPSANDVMATLSRLGDDDQSKRSDAFYKLLEMGVGSGLDLKGKTGAFYLSLSQLFIKAPSKKDEIKIQLIELLSKETSVMREHADRQVEAGGSSTHGVNTYYSDLIAAVALLQDPRALNPLLDVIANGYMARWGVAKLWRVSLDPLIELFSRDDAKIRDSAAAVLRFMIDPDYDMKLDDPISREKIKHVLMRGAEDGSYDTRLESIEGLGILLRLGNKDVTSILKNAALNDPYELPRQPGIYPIREIAKKLLQMGRN
jgi:hypothetical protein